MLDVAAEGIKTYTTGRYGLIDVFYRHIWINHWSEGMAHFVSRAFWSKASTVVYDLSWFENYSDQSIDYNVCLDWKIPVCQDWRTPVVRLSFKNQKLFNTQTTYESRHLINEPNGCNLDPSQLRELQSQMLLLFSVLECLYYPHIKEPDLLDELVQIFATEIRTKDIYDRLYDMASTNISGCDQGYSKILRLIDRLYA